MAGPDSPIRRFEHCWFPYTGRLTGESLSMGYWILWPNTNTFDPTKPYPLFIMLQGGTIGDSRAMHTGDTPSTGGAVIQCHNYDIPGSPYYTHEAIVILPDTSDYNEWLEANIIHNSDNFYWKGRFKYGQFSGMHPLRAMVDALINQTINFYNTSDCTTVHTGFLDTPIVDTDRIYLAGFSYGGGACFPFLEQFRDLAAAVVMGAGWFCSPVYGDATRKLSDDFLEECRLYLKQAVKRFWDIPILFHAGEHDRMWYNSILAIEEMYNVVESEKAEIRKSYFVWLHKAVHSGSSWGDTGFSKYSSTKYYYKQQMVKHNEYIYKALQESQGQEPVGETDEYWELQVKPWIVGISFSAGDFCSYNSGLYIVNQNVAVTVEGEEPDIATDYYSSYEYRSYQGWSNRSWYFDPDVKIIQEFSSNSANRINAIDWLFSKTRPTLSEDVWGNEVTEEYIIYQQNALNIIDLGFLDDITKFRQELNTFDYNTEWLNILYYRYDDDNLVEQSKYVIWTKNGSSDYFDDVELIGTEEIEEGFRLSKKNNRIFLYMPKRYLLLA